jgi:hypothetical protein
MHDPFTISEVTHPSIPTLSRAATFAHLQGLAADHVAIFKRLSSHISSQIQVMTYSNREILTR